MDVAIFFLAMAVAAQAWGMRGLKARVKRLELAATRAMLEGMVSRG